MRADARANREAVLNAARQLYAAHGIGIPYSQIAAEAGVGIATLYRHFPTQDELILGLVEQIATRVDVSVETRSEQFSRDPETAWRGFVTDLVDLKLGTLLPQLVEYRGKDALPPEAVAIRTRVLASVGRLLEQAKDAGLLRRDADPFHFQATIGVLTRPLPTYLTDELPDLREWLIEVVINGVRPPAAGQPERR